MQLVQQHSVAVLIKRSEILEHDCLGLFVALKVDVCSAILTNNVGFDLPPSLMGLAHPNVA